MRKRLKKLTAEYALVKEQEDDIQRLRSFIIKKEQESLTQKRRELSSNITISGLNEPEDEEQDELMSKINKLMNDISAQIEIVAAFRLGKRTDHRPRLIKVITASQQYRNEILRKAKFLKGDSRYKNVFINRDRCLIDRKENTRLRKVLKTLRVDFPDKKVVLRNGKVTVDDEIVDRESPLSHLFASL